MRTITSARIRSARATRRGGAFAVAVAGCLAGAQQAQAQAQQGVLPAYGTDVRVGDLRTQFSRTFDTDPKIVSDRIWTFSPSIDISESFDSGVRLPNGFGKDYITRITPGFVTSAETRRLKGTFTYNPTVSVYALHGGENGVAQNLNTNATATLVEDLLFFDLRGYATTQPILGGLVTPGSTGSNRNSDVQTTNFTAGPYLQKRFGDTATVQAGYAVTRSTMSSLAAKGTTPLVAGINSNFTSEQENASVTAGPDFGRITSSLSAMATQYEGAGVYNGAHNETFSLAVGYAVTRAITVNSSIGHEVIAYGPGGPKKIDEITWSGGVHLVPNADSSVTASYGRQQGGSSLSFDGNYAPATRIRLMARYSQGIGTGLQNLQNALAGTTAGPAGIPVDRVTNAPVQLGSLLGQQPGVYRTTSASVNMVVQFDRDTVNLGWTSTDRMLLSQSGGAGAGVGSNSGMDGTVAWQHLLSEALSTNATLQYGIRNVPGLGGGDSTTASASASVNYALSETLSTNALISHTQTKGKTFGIAPTRDLVVLGLHKAF